MIRIRGIIAGMVLATLAVAPVASGDIVLSDFNSQVVFRQNDVNQIIGMNDWIVDGTDHLFTQWFWFRVGNVAEQSMSVLTQTINAQAVRYLDVTFADPNGAFAIDVTYSLQGGSAGSGLSDVAEQIRVRNTGQTALDFHFFQYSDFDLNGTIGDDTVVLDGFSQANVFDGGGGVLNETVLTPPASHREAGIFPGTRTKLNDGNPDDLNDVGGPLSGVDATWAFQWDRLIGVGGSFLISKDKSIQTVIPAPGAALLGVLGLSLVGYIKRRFS